MALKFGNLPIEMQMMFFDHLVTDKISLGKVCLVSDDWKTIMQNSYCWKLWKLSMLGKDKARGLMVVNYPIRMNIAIDNPIFHVQFAPIDQVSNRVKNLLFTKFLYVLGLNSHPLYRLKVNNDHLSWFQIMCLTGNIDGAKLLHRIFNITKENVQANHNLAFIWSCGNGHLSIAQWLHETFHLTSEDAQAKDNLAWVDACNGGYIEVVEWLYSTFQSTFDAESWGNIIYVMTLAYINLVDKHVNVNIKSWMEKTFGFTERVS